MDILMSLMLKKSDIRTGCTMRGTLVFPCRLTGQLIRPRPEMKAVGFMRVKGWQTPDAAWAPALLRRTVHMPVVK